MSDIKYKRILLKLSGEALGEGVTENVAMGLDFQKIHAVCEVIKQCHDLGVQIGLVIGGGNFWRGVKNGSGKMQRSHGDAMGMLATVMNSLALADSLEQLGCDVRVQTAIAMQQIAEPYIRNKAVRHLEKGRIVIFGCGTGNPFFSTDTASALRAAEIGADAILKATLVDGVYDSDPKVNPDAKKYEEVSIQEVIDKKLAVVDLTASIMCMENKMPMLVFGLEEENSIIKTVHGEFNGTKVTI